MVFKNRVMFGHAFNLEKKVGTFVSGEKKSHEKVHLQIFFKKSLQCVTKGYFDSLLFLKKKVKSVWTNGA